MTHGRTAKALLSCGYRNAGGGPGPGCGGGGGGVGGGGGGGGVGPGGPGGPGWTARGLPAQQYLRQVGSRGRPTPPRVLRFPFMSRPPQFAPGPELHVPSGQGRGQGLYRIDSKTLGLKSKPSVSNPNVLFCTPEDMQGTIIY